MVDAAYLPLVLPLVAGPFAPLIASRLPPRAATPILTAIAVVLAVCGTVSLVSLVARFGATAEGASGPGATAEGTPVSTVVATVALCLLVLSTASAVVSLARRRRALRDVRRHYLGSDPGGLPDGDHPVVHVPDPRPLAFSLPGRRRAPGRVIVSAGMLEGLDAAERVVLQAHEWSHLRNRHHRLVSAARLAAAANPLLRPVAAATTFAAERWADEDAAAVTRDRRLTANAVGRAALLASAYEAGGRGVGGDTVGVAGGVRAAAVLRISGALGVSGAITGLRRPGVVPRRVAALLAPPLPARPWWTAVCALMMVTAVVTAGAGVHDLGSALGLLPPG